MRAAELGRPAEEAMTKTVNHAKEATEAAPNAEVAENIAAIRANGACLKGGGTEGVGQVGQGS